MRFHEYSFLNFFHFFSFVIFVFLPFQFSSVFLNPRIPYFLNLFHLTKGCHWLSLNNIIILEHRTVLVASGLADIVVYFPLVRQVGVLCQLKTRIANANWKNRHVLWITKISRKLCLFTFTWLCIRLKWLISTKNVFSFYVWLIITFCVFAILQSTVLVN